LTTLGVRHLRDGYFDHPESSVYTKEHHTLAAHGIRTTYVVPTEASATTSALTSFAKLVDDFEGFEAPNECDALLNCGGGGAAGINQMMSLLPQISSAANSVGAALTGPSFVLPDSYIKTGDLSQMITYNNAHVYFGGNPPGSQGWGDFDKYGNSYGSLNFWLAAVDSTAPSAATVISETGYMSYERPTQPYTISDTVGGKYIPRTLLLAFLHGVKRTYVYELLDEFSSPAYGILHSDFTPKPAYTAIKNLTSTLSDTGPAFTPDSLPYTMSGGDATLNHLLLEKRDGSFWLILWLEQSCLDRVSLEAQTVTPQKIVLTVGGKRSAQHLLSFDDYGNMSWKSVAGQDGSLTLTVDDHMSIVEILPN